MAPLLQFDVFTLFPEVLEPYIQASILARAQQNDLIQIDLHNIRNWTYDRHHITDDMPYGGGGGMVMKPDPIFAAVEACWDIHHRARLSCSHRREGCSPKAWRMNWHSQP